jgi:hypothetical protein
MAEYPQPTDGRQRPAGRKKRPGPIRVLPPDVVPMSKEDEQQAVAAIAAMIAAWWHDHPDQ